LFFSKSGTIEKKTRRKKKKLGEKKNAAEKKKLGEKKNAAENNTGGRWVVDEHHDNDFQKTNKQERLKVFPITSDVQSWAAYAPDPCARF
jgi:2-methylcitrate dehydratase PrpD